MINDEKHVEVSYVAERRRVDAVASEIFESLDINSMLSVKQLARMYHEVDPTSDEQMPWDDLDEETQSHYIRIALWWKTGYDVRVDKQFRL